MNRTQIDIPALVRVKSGAAGRVGLYARRQAFTDIVLLYSGDLQPELMKRLEDAARERRLVRAESRLTIFSSICASSCVKVRFVCLSAMRVVGLRCCVFMCAAAHCSVRPHRQVLTIRVYRLQAVIVCSWHNMLIL